MLLKDKWNKLKYWQKGGIIGLIIGVIILLIPLLFTAVITFLNFGQPDCPRWEGSGSPICNLNTLVEDIVLIYFLSWPILISTFVTSIVLGMFIGCLVNKFKIKK